MQIVCLVGNEKVERAPALMLRAGSISGSGTLTGELRRDPGYRRFISLIKSMYLGETPL